MIHDELVGIAVHREDGLVEPFDFLLERRGKRLVPAAPLHRLPEGQRPMECENYSGRPRGHRLNERLAKPCSCRNRPPLHFRIVCRCARRERSQAVAAPHQMDGRKHDSCMRPASILDELSKLRMIGLRLERNAPAAEALTRVTEEDLAHSREALARRKATGTRRPAIGPFVVAGAVDHRMAQAVEPVEGRTVMVVSAGAIEYIAHMQDPAQIVRVHVLQDVVESQRLPCAVRRIAEGREREGSWRVCCWRRCSVRGPDHRRVIPTVPRAKDASQPQRRLCMARIVSDAASRIFLFVRKDAAGTFLWPGYRDNMHVARWISGRVLAKESPLPAWINNAALLWTNAVSLTS